MQEVKVLESDSAQTTELVAALLRIGKVIRMRVSIGLRIAFLMTLVIVIAGAVIITSAPIHLDANFSFGARMALYFSVLAAVIALAAYSFISRPKR